MLDTNTVEEDLTAILVGVGGFGQVWWDVNRTNPGVRIIAAVDPDPSALVTGGEVLGLGAENRFPNLNDALSAAPANIIIDSTPPDYHLENALAAFERGMHVFTAKPMAVDWAAAVRMTEAADAAGLVLGVNEQLRYGWLPLSLTHLMQTGEIGKVESIEVSFREPSAWEGWRKIMDHPLLLDGAIQHFDMVRSVTGLEAESVFCSAWRREGSTLSGAGSAAALFQLSGGIPFMYTGTWDHSRESVDRTGWWGEWRICGSRGEIRAEGNRGIWVNGSQSAVVVEALDVKRLSLVLLDQFLRTIRTSAAMATDGWNDLKSMAMSEMAIRSANTSQPIKLEQLDPPPASRNEHPLETLYKSTDNNIMTG